MIGSIGYSLRNLFNFSGRDARSTFWLYLLFLVVLQFAVSIITIAPVYFEMFSAAFDAGQSGAQPEDLERMMLGNMAGMMERQVLVGLAVTIVSGILFAASFVRRLHDSGKSGWWLLAAYVPVFGSALYNYAYLDDVLAVMQASMTPGSPADTMARQSELYAYSALSYIGYLVVIVFGVMKSDEGPNRYGPEPVGA
ncbi:DUF805 domain-containing protein [Qipengyuania sp. JC766]|uniref:DUF805 domain-containing protein n=1 Tax=Qipengyuania sp. JC766 TaxID=3232139 RepID=UPI00345894A8